MTMAPIRPDHTQNMKARPKVIRDETRAIVVHYPDAIDWSAQDTRDYFDKSEIEASTQFSVDKVEIVQIMPPDEVAWQVGREAYRKHHGIRRPYGENPNEYLVGMEISHGKNGEFSQATLNNAAWLCAWLCRRYDLDPMHRIIRHYDIIGKLCPVYFVEHVDKFDLFKNQVKELVLEEIYFDTERGEYL